ncbi:MAG: ASCH domain-containing protein [Phycisphaerae bacterium]
MILPRYLQLIVSGQKRIECRIAGRVSPPFGSVQAGDQIWFKLRCGPVCATARVQEVRYYWRVSRDELGQIRRRFDRQICAEPRFWSRRGGDSNVVLIWLEQVRPCGPLAVVKTDRRGWVALPGPPQPGQRIG